METRLKLATIGHVHVSEEEFFLQLNQKYILALKGLDGFNYLNILWWAHLLDNIEQRNVFVCQKPYKKSSAEMGIFATRSPSRPNPIGLSVVSVLNIDYNDGKIIIPYIDAEDHTPILDIKPYHPAIDRVKEVEVPKWCRHWPRWIEDSATFDWANEFENAQ
jgi:tRNA-Thr(GGU) m(6)t(6)A37 methyltransferase TsaA